jgi:hypothetical protein
LNIIQLLQNFSVPYSTEGKNVQNGWIGVQCPFCGDISNHMGFNLQDNYFSCWRCGGRPLITTISKLINVNEAEVRKIIKRYDLVVPKRTDESLVKIRTKAFKLPSNTVALLPHHKEYLAKRNFDPDYLEKKWGLLSTGPVSKLDNIDYKHRIIIPFIWDEKIVTFDSRDVTGKDLARYKACPKDRELIPHKSILYGKQEKWKKTGILVEGPTDVWRFGPFACATSGIKYTNRQVRCISKSFSRVAVCFDSDNQASYQADKMVSELKFRGVDAFRVDIESDPGSMKQEDANYLVKNLIG